MPEYIGGWKLLRLLGAGGMGRVYEAIDASGHTVAIKLLSPHWIHSRDALERFKLEGAIASAINHPRCVFVQTADEENGQPYIVMELMTGQNLKDLVELRGALPYREAIACILDVIDGLQEAHENGMIHRDVKPANCYLEANGRIKIGDFGLARSLIANSELTTTGSFVGTPLFASPEQLRGEELDVRTDIYSVCATLYFLLTGKAPFDNPNAALVIARIASEDAAPMRTTHPDIPLALEQAVLRGLRRNREERFSDLRELKNELQPFLSGRQAFTTLGRRFGGYVIDSILFSIVTTIILALFNDGPGVAQVMPLQIYAAVMLPSFFYFFLTELYFGYSLGKYLMRLKVVDCNTAQKPSAIRIFLRTILWFLLCGILADLSLYLLMDPANTQQWFLLQLIGYLVTNLVLISTIGRNGSQRLLHEWISGTQVLPMPAVVSKNDISHRAPHWQPNITANDSFPERIGRYHIEGILHQNENETWLDASDRSLHRHVWILMRSPESSPLPENRRRCSRTTRMRWLSGSATNKFRWDAFLAPDGVPLSKWNIEQQPLSWEPSSALLQQWLDELEASSQDSTRIESIDVNQLWLDRYQKLVIAEPPLASESSSSSLLRFSVANDTNALESTSQLTRYCLTGKTSVDPKSPIRAVAPGSAQKILARLTHSKDRFGNVTEVSTALKKSAERSPRSTTIMRLVHAMFLLAALSPLIGVWIVLSRMGNLLVMESLDASTRNLALLDEIASQPEEFNKFVSALPKGYQVRFDRQQILQDVPNALADSSKQLQTRFDRSSIFDRTAFRLDRFSGDRATIYREAKVKIGTSANRTYALVKDPAGTSNTQAQSTPPINVAEVTGRDIADSWLRWLDKKPIPAERKEGTFLSILLVPFGVLILQGTLFRGGIIRWLAGLMILRYDGAKPSWPRLFYRSCLVWFIPCLITFTVIYIDLYVPSFFKLADLLRHIFSFVPIAFTIMAARYPSRGPHDWLAGTVVVPR